MPVPAPLLNQSHQNTKNKSNPTVENRKMKNRNISTTSRIAISMYFIIILSFVFYLPDTKVAKDFPPAALPTIPTFPFGTTKGFPGTVGLSTSLSEIILIQLRNTISTSPDTMKGGAVPFCPEEATIPNSFENRPNL